MFRYVDLGKHGDFVIQSDFDMVRLLDTYVSSDLADYLQETIQDKEGLDEQVNWVQELLVSMAEVVDILMDAIEGNVTVEGMDTLRYWANCGELPVDVERLSTTIERILDNR